MKNKIQFIPILIIAIVLLAVPVIARAESPILAELTTEEKELTVGDPILIILSVIHPNDHVVIFPEMESTWGDFYIKNQSPVLTIDNNDGTRTSVQEIDVRLFSPGTFTTPQLPITVSDSNGELDHIMAQPLTLMISSVLINGDTELRDIKPQAELPYINSLPWIIGSLLAVLVLLTVVLLWRRRQTLLALAAIDNRLPHEIAVDELNRIEKLHLLQRRKYKEYYSLVSNCIRLYIEKSYHIPMLERTTGEVRKNLSKSNMKSETIIKVVSFLNSSDFVKFSTFSPELNSAIQLIQDGHQIIEETKPIKIETDLTSNDQTTDASQSNPEYHSRKTKPQTEVTA
jgi:hypothetical protein